MPGKDCQVDIRIVDGEGHNDQQEGCYALNLCASLNYNLAPFKVMLCQIQVLKIRPGTKES